MGSRAQALAEWIADTYTSEPIELAPLSGDASFRRYFRLNWQGQSLVAVDAPPEKENSQPFVAVAQAFAARGLNVPKVLKADLAQGFMLLSDLGDLLYAHRLNGDSADGLYRAAIDALLDLQGCDALAEGPFPDYDRALLARELQLLPDWLLSRELGLKLDAADLEILNASFELLIHSALNQPQACVHRDYHSRNLMVCDNQTPGILDFQDAVWGPVTYDLVSLLRDCYVAWAPEQVRIWALYYFEQAKERGLIPAATEATEFLRWFDWMGIQRHFKASGIFARLHIRDGKTGYLKDIPRTLGYVLQVGAQYSEFDALVHWLQERVVPHFPYLENQA